jgi:hypothetical protein
MANTTPLLTRLGYHAIGYTPDPVRVERYDAQRHYERWEQFLAGTASGLFQSRRFRSYHSPGRFEDHSLLFWRGDALIGVAAGEESDGRWSSHRFASHAGIAVLLGLSPQNALDIVHADDRAWNATTMRIVPDVLAESSFTTLVWALEVAGVVSVVAR